MPISFRGMDKATGGLTEFITDLIYKSTRRGEGPDEAGEKVGQAIGKLVSYALNSAINEVSDDPAMQGMDDDFVAEFELALYDALSNALLPG